MIKASELRIGNRVKRRSKEEKLTVDLKLLVKIQRMPYLFEPIPLTEEWLLKFGFQKDNDFGNWHLDDYEIFSSGNRHFIAATKEGAVYWYNDSSDDYYSSVKKIETVHQLQNLYFALTGEELEIK